MNSPARTLGRLLAICMLLLLAGCTTPGGYAPYPGGGYGQPGPGYPAYGNQLQGTVERVDPRNGRIQVWVDDGRSGRARRVDLRYDRGTRLYYQGREHPVDGLERGDVIRFDSVQSGRELYVRQIEVIRDVRDGYGGGYGPGNDLRGSVTSVDTRARVIRLGGTGYGSATQVYYDARTTVEYQGRMYRPENLERGDLVRIQARRSGNNQWLAERIIVERSARY